MHKYAYTDEGQALDRYDLQGEWQLPSIWGKWGATLEVCIVVGRYIQKQIHEAVFHPNGIQFYMV